MIGFVERFCNPVWNHDQAQDKVQVVTDDSPDQSYKNDGAGGIEDIAVILLEGILADAASSGGWANHHNHPKDQLAGKN